MKPNIFIGSSAEGIAIAEAIERHLQHKFEVTVWKSGVFNLSSTTIDDLLEKLSESDFGIFVFSADDLATIGESNYSIARDNVLYELELYTGRLGGFHTFIITPSISPLEFHLPSDLIGITVGQYDPKRGNLLSAVSPFCGQLKDQVFNSKYTFNGKWSFSWEVKNSANYPDTVVG
jgi:predicted nucleotide-binding protein